MMELLAAQLTSLTLLFIGTFLSGILPILCFRCGTSTIRRGRGNARINAAAASYLVNFGGGILLCVALLQLLPRARVEISEHSKFEDINVTGINNGGHAHNHHHSHSEPSGHHHHSLPLAEFTVGCGFFVAFMVHVILQALLNRTNTPNVAEHPSGHRDRFCSCSMRNIECSRTYKHKPVTPHPAALSERRRRSATWDGALMASKRLLMNKPDEVSQILSPPDILQSSFISHPLPNYGSVGPTTPLIPSPQPLQQDSHGRLIHGEGGITIATRAVAVPPHLPNIPEGELPGSTTIAKSPISLGSVLIVLALSAPSIIEGIAIGLQQTPDETWTVFLVTAMHKFIVSFVVGVAAFADGESKIYLITLLMATFASMTPIGITTALLSGMSEVSGMAAGVLDSLAAGVVMYVIFYELWPKQQVNNACSNGRFVARLFGLVFMTALQYAATLL